MKDIRVGDLVRFIGIGGTRYDGDGVCPGSGVIVNGDMEQFLRGKVFRVRATGATDVGRVLIEVCEQTQDKRETQKHIGWCFTAGMFEPYEDSKNETLEFTYDQLIMTEVREANV